MGLIAELRHRNVIRMAVLYVVAAWLVMQVAGVLIDLGALPERAGPWVLAALATGLPIALAVSWFFDITPEGVRRESEAADAAPVAEAAIGSRRTDFVIIAMLSAAVILLLFWEPPRTAGDALTVLPFETLGGAEEADFSRGLSFELLNLLAQTRQFKVKQPPEASVAAHFDDVPTLSRELGVRWVLQGNVRRAQSRIRVGVQLIDSFDDAAIVWSNVFDRELSAANLFHIQAEIARAVTSQLQGALTAPAEQRLKRTPTESTEAYTAYLIGRERLRDRKVEELDDAIHQFSRAIELDPGFAGAYSGLADACAHYGDSSGHPHDTCPAAIDYLELARRAVALDEGLGEAWISLADALEYFRSDPEDFGLAWDEERSAALHVEVDAAFERGLELNPSYSPGYAAYARHLYGGHFDDEDAWWAAWQDGAWWKWVEKGLEVDPLSIELHGMARYAGWVKTRDKALWHTRRIIEIAPDSPLGYSRLGEIRWRDYGHADDMVRWSGRALKIDPQAFAYCFDAGLAYLALGDFDIARAYFARDKVLRPDPQEYFQTDALAELYAGHTDEAIAILEFLLDEPNARDKAPYLAILTGLDLAGGDPARALSRFREYLPDCFPVAEDDDTSEYCGDLYIARVFQALGDEERARLAVGSMIGTYEADWKYHDLLEYDIGLIFRLRAYAVAGRHEEALSMLERVVDQGFRGYRDLGLDWRFFAYHDVTVDSIRGNPRFQAAIATIEADMAQQLENVREMEQKGEVPTLAELLAVASSD